MLFSLQRRRPTTTPRCPRFFRPQLEGLEDRCVPTTVMNLNDSGDGSLRQAILDTPAGGTVDFQSGLSGTIALATGELAIGADLTIAGPGADTITVSGSNASRVFDIAAGVTVAIAGLTVADGSASGSGGGILNAGRLALNEWTVHGCAASSSSATFF
jgi:hypothetical protein